MNEYITSRGPKNLLRVIVCGTPNGGKSTLIDQLQHHTRLEYEKQTPGAKDTGFQLFGNELDEESTQGLSSDVATHCFATGERRFIVADTRGGEHDTRHLITAAANADLAVLLIDAGTGLLTQNRHQAFLLSLMGVKHIVVAVNKIDLVNYSSDVFNTIDLDFRGFASPLGFTTITSIPISALKGENVTRTSSLMPWYGGPAVLACLEEVEIAAKGFKPFRFPVREINRPESATCELSGIIRGGAISAGDEVMVTSSLKKSRVAEIATRQGSVTRADTGEAVTLVLEDNIDITCGDLLATPGNLPQSSDQFQAKIFWLHEETLLVGRSYHLTIGSQTSHVQITDIKHAINVNTQEHLAAPKLEMNEVAVCNLATSKPVFFDAYSDNPATGCFILVDRLTNATVGVGIIDFSLRRADNLSWQSFETDAGMRARMKGQTSSILWFTGLSASGKSTIVDLVDRKLVSRGVHTYILDGDNVRHGLNKDLGFTDADRVENIRRVAEVARLMADAGLVVLVSFISPFVRERKLAREIAGAIDFQEIFVDTPLEICEARDPKGLYAKARKGDLANFTGISSPFEAPDNPDLRLPGGENAAEELADMVIRKFSL